MTPKDNKKILDNILKASQAIENASRKSSGDFIMVGQRMAKFLENIKSGYNNSLRLNRLEKIKKILDNI